MKTTYILIHKMPLDEKGKALAFLQKKVNQYANAMGTHSAFDGCVTPFVRKYLGYSAALDIAKAIPADWFETVNVLDRLIVNASTF